MNWFEALFCEHSALQAVAVLSVVIAFGLALGKLRIKGISLGVTFVFFMGILAGHLGFSIDPEMLKYAEDFGLVLFVYELGLKVGPGFFSSFRQGGVKLNMLGMGVVLLGTLLAIAFCPLFGVEMSDMVGILSGATTNTPALGAAQQALQQAGLDAAGAALSCAVTYPLGVVGVILAMIVIRKFFTRKKDLEPHTHEDGDHTFVAEFKVTNPGIGGVTVKDAAKLINQHFVISRCYRDGKVSIPGPDSQLALGDELLVVTNEEDVAPLSAFFGERLQIDWNRPNIDWDAIDKRLVSKEVVVSKASLNGKRLGSLRLRNMYGVNISRVTRAGVRLLATPSLILQLGDRLTVVGEESGVDKVAETLGNSVSDLKDPNLGAIFIGMVLGLILGSIPILIPGVDVPVKLGLAGGPIVMGIIIGRFGPRFHLVTYTTRSANLMLRGIGLSLYLACLGLSSGAQFLDTIMKADGLRFIGIGFLLTIIPVILMLLLSMRIWKLDFGSACGMACGAMANPMALNYANDTLKGDEAAVSYATVYPLSMFSRVVIAQLLVLLFI